MRIRDQIRVTEIRRFTVSMDTNQYFLATEAGADVFDLIADILGEEFGGTASIESTLDTGFELTWSVVLEIEHNAKT